MLFKELFLALIFLVKCNKKILLLNQQKMPMII